MNNKNIEELLKPRYKVMADYPHSPYTINQVLDIELYDNERWEFEHGLSLDKIPSEDVSKYPHLFKKLEWWEERTPDEMPKYVKRITDNRMFKIADPSEDNRRWHNDNEIENRYFVKYASLFLPITEEEYSQQKQST